MITDAALSLIVLRQIKRQVVPNFFFQKRVLMFNWDLDMLSFKNIGILFFFMYRQSSDSILYKVWNMVRCGIYSYSCLMVWGASANPLTLSLSAVFKNAGNWSWATLTSPAYMNSRIAVKCWKGTSFRMMIGCLAGFSSRRAWNK